MIGGLIIIVGLVAVLMIHEGGHLLTAKAFGMKVTKYFLGFGPTLWSFHRGETEYGIKAIPAGGYVLITGMNPLEDVSPEEEYRTYRRSPFHQKALVVMAGVATHFVLAFILIWIANVVIGEPDHNLPLLEISQIVPKTLDGFPTAAMQAGLEPGDHIIAVDGSPIGRWGELTEILRSNPNQFISLEVERDGRRMNLGATLTSRTDLNSGQEIGFLGVSPRIGKSRDNPITGIGTATVKVAEFTRQSVLGLWAFVANFDELVGALFGDDDVLSEVRPVSLIGVAQFGAASQKAGLNYTFELLAYIAIFIGVLNAVPLHPFDGGHLAVAIYEKVTGRHPDVRKLLPVATIVIFFIVVVGLLGIYFDIMRPIDLG